MIVTSDRAIRFFEFILRMNIRAITIFPFIILRSDANPDAILINHERIHLRQQLELLIIPFYVWYLLEYFSIGYYNNVFEKEAYANEKNLDYLKSRKLFNFAKYIFKFNKRINEGWRIYFLSFF